MIKKEIKNRGEFIIYSGKRGGVELRADADKETIWASLDQIAELFGRDKSVISRHLRNVFSEAELDRNSVVAKNATTAADGKTYIVEYYNLDAVLSVGYRVNSRQATQFRIWATKTLREYLIKGIVINTERIKKLPDKILADLNEKLEFIQRTLEKRELNKSETNSLLAVIHDYAHSWLYLKEYDDGELRLYRGKNKEKRHLNYDFVRQTIDTMKVELMSSGQAGELFASERDESFKGILKTIYQTFGGTELYQSLEEKAAHLLYFIIKDHPFSDGNKRVASFLFIYFLQLNGILKRSNGERKINDNTLVALALLIAESDPKDKEVMVALTTNLLA
ncbi:MAG: virulence protein RhuM/Fic/DOC family protein [Candidatus Paceibacterota bacterium]